MPTPERYAVLAKLPDAGPFRRVLAIERGGVPRAVMVYTPPPDLADDPVRLPALIRDAEAAARFRHAHSLSVMGLETVGEGPSIVESYRPGATLREVLDAGGRLPPPVAARVALDLCGVLGVLHAFDAGDGKPLVHGAIAPDRVWLSDRGDAALCGLGTGAGTDPTDDVRGVAGVLAECLSGEKPGERFDAPGVPPGIASVVNRYRTPASAVLGPAALAEAITAGVKPAPAPREALAAWLDSVLPPGKGVRAERATLVEDALGPEARFGGAAAGSRGRVAAPKDEPKLGPDQGPPAPEEPAEEVAVDQIVDQAALSAKTIPMMRAVTAADLAAALDRAAAATASGAPEPTPVAVPADAARTFPAPRPTGRPIGVLVAAGVAFGTLGFGGGFALSRAGAPASPETPLPQAPVAAVPAVAPAPVPAPGGANRPDSTRKVRKEAAPRPALSTSRAAPPAPRPAPSAGAAPSQSLEPGLLTVTAPSGAEVRLDGKPLGVGSLKREVTAGAHRIEVRLGDATVSETFTMEAAGTYTYEVSPPR